MHIMQIKSWIYMLQANENYNNIQEPTNKQNWKIFHIVNCKKEYAIYLMECTICNLQYVVKNETPFNIRLTNHRKDVKDPEAILADKHFQKNGHRFNEHARFAIIGRLKNTNLDKEILRESLIQRENFCIQKIQKLGTLYPKALNQELNM